MVKQAAERMAQDNPQMRLVYVLREPVARVESECLQFLKYAKNVLGEDHTHMALDDVFALIENPDQPYYAATVASSRYIEQIEILEKAFPTEQILILTQDALLTNRQAFLDRVFDFLGVEGFTFPEEGTKRNVTAGFTDGVAREHTAERLRKLPLYSTLKLLFPEAVKKKIVSMWGAKVIAANLRLSPALRDRLTDDFRTANRRLAAKIGPLPPGWQT
jgi:hypothetical protein